MLRDIVEHGHSMPCRWGTVFCTLRWRHNEHDSVSNHQPRDCLLNGLFRRISKKTSKLRVTGLCMGNSPGPVNSPHKGPVTRKCFHLMTSSWTDPMLHGKPVQYTSRHMPIDSRTFMMTSSNGNIFRVTGPLCGKFTGHRWIPLTKASDAELWCYFDLRLE